MRPVKRPVAWIKAGLVGFLGLAIAGTPLLAIAQTFVPPQRGLPGRREGGGTRDPRACIRGNPGQLVALLPDTNLGLTTASHPEFFWFIPRTRAQQAEFTLYTVDAKLANQSIVHKAIFEVPSTPGVYSFKLPANANIPPLNVGQDYRWTLTLLCELNNRRRDIKVEGWVQRVVPDGSIAKQLRTADPRARVELLAKNGLWFDTLTTLAEMRCANPQDSSITANWSALLKSVKLDPIADQPLLQQCPPKPQR